MEPVIETEPATEAEELLDPNGVYTTKEDVALFAKHIGKGVRIKAAGGISSLEDAEAFIALGADRLGTSRIVKIAKNLADDGSY